MPSRKIGPRVLFLDIENWPMKVSSWGLYNQNHNHKQIKQNKSILSFAAKYWKEKEVIYEDVSRQRDLHSDDKLAKSLRRLLDNADIVIGHNFQKFDRKVINTALVTNKTGPAFRYRILDTMLIARKHFDFPSYSLEYLTARLCPHTKKQKSRKFIGEELWDECEKRNPEAWKEMCLYNCQDIRATEALWNVIEPYDNSINFNVYTGAEDLTCKCGGAFVGNGTSAKGLVIRQRYRCNKCGAEAKGKDNLLEKDQRKKLLLAP